MQHINLVSSSLFAIGKTKVKTQRNYSKISQKETKSIDKHLKNRLNQVSQQAKNSWLQFLKKQLLS
jgi:hypothetical protein